MILIAILPHHTQKARCLNCYVNGWAQQLQALHHRIAPRFARSEQRKRSLAYLKALLSPLPRKNGWQVAEQIAEATPDGVQRLLNAAHWDVEAVREDLQVYVLENLADADAVLVLDETGFLKKGNKSVGVQRQYSGTAGRIENCQVAVFLCYASPRGATFLDRALYLPKDWASDSPRREEAGVPASVRFATKPHLARAMLRRAQQGQIPFGWVTGDSVYGSDRRLRMELEQSQCAFVLAVTSQEKLFKEGPLYHRADTLAAEIAPQDWQCLSAGEGAKGPRLYDWALVELWRLQLTDQERAWGHYLLVRRSLDKPEEIAYYLVFCPREKADLPTLAQVAGRRWNVESCFESSKGECGLDQYEVRKWDSWHRHITLSMLAHAFLTVMRFQALSQEPPETSIEQESDQKGGVFAA